MYLYNGHRAPALPVYDPGELPYGLIVSANADNTALILMLCVNRPYYGTNPSDSTKTGVYNTGRMKVYTCIDTDESWTFDFETENPLTANDDDPGGGILWTLEDILKSDGSIWMAGTQPVPERVTEAWVRSFLEGLALGLMGAPLPYTGTEPAPEPEPEAVAYLYGHIATEGETPTHTINGVDYVGAVLPPLPEYDKSKYLYALIGTDSIRPYMLTLSTLPMREMLFTHNSTKGSAGISYKYHDDTNEWSWANTWDETGSPFSLPNNPAIWANFDVMNSAETAVSVKATEPIPIYE